MQSIQFMVKGSSPEPYETVFYFDSHNMHATCTCAAGKNGQYCKHRLQILSGDTSSIVSGNLKDVTTILSSFKGTPLENKIHELKECEAGYAKITTQLSKIKKELSHIFIAVS